MNKKVSITDSNKATFVCPKCEQTKTVDVTKFVYTDNAVKVHSKCSCGHKWTSLLERRKEFRKMVNLPGSYDYIKDDMVVARGRMKVIDLSFSGIKIKLNIERNLQMGETLNLEFHLDDNKRTLIQKRVQIRSVRGLSIGTTFRSGKDIGPGLGFYLMD
jgi:hypothetical protein